MGKIIKVVTALLVFIIVNLYLVVRLLERVDVFRLENAPFAVDVVSDDIHAVGGIVDIDNDGNNEIVFESRDVSANRTSVWVLDPSKKDVPPATVVGKIEFPYDYYVFDVYRDKPSKSPVFRLLDSQTGEFVLKEVDIHGKNQKKDLPFEKIGNKTDGTTFSFSRPVFVDLDTDGKDEMLIVLYSHYIHSPRGVVCFEPGTGKLLWKYDMGVLVQDTAVLDLDGDGKKEIVISTNAVNNGAAMNGTDDAHSYVIVLDHRGNLRWKEETGEWYTRAQSMTADLDNDGRMEIVTAISSHRIHNPVKGKLFVFDAVTGDKKAGYYLPHASFSGPFIHSSGHRGVRVFVGDGTGCIRMFDHRLNLLKTINESAPVHVLNTFTPSIRWPGLFVLTNERLLAFDWDLERKVFDYRFEHPILNGETITGRIISPFRIRGKRGTLIGADRLLWLRQIEGSFFKAVTHVFTSGLAVAAAALLLFNMFFVYSLRGMSASTGRELRESTRFIHTLREIAGRLKNPVSTISWTAEKIKRNTNALGDEKNRENFLQLSGFLAEDGKTLKQHANRLLRLVQIYKPVFRDVALKPFLLRLVDHYRTVMGEHIRVRLEMEEDIRLSLDEELFREVLVNLVDNALDAMSGTGTGNGGSGELTLSVVPVTSPVKGRIEQVVVEVEDSGCGIEESDLPSVFDSFFTKKEKGKGVGIGLFICKRIIHAHQGKIDIYSRKNFGTKVTVTLPVKRKRWRR